jgi:hypothetical protein
MPCIARQAMYTWDTILVPLLTIYIITSKTTALQEKMKLDIRYASLVYKVLFKMFFL